MTPPGLGLLPHKGALCAAIVEACCVTSIAAQEVPAIFAMAILTQVLLQTLLPACLCITSSVQEQIRDTNNLTRHFVLTVYD